VHPATSAPTTITADRTVLLGNFARTGIAVRVIIINLSIGYSRRAYSTSIDTPIKSTTIELDLASRIIGIVTVVAIPVPIHRFVSRNDDGNIRSSSLPLLAHLSPLGVYDAVPFHATPYKEGEHHYHTKKTCHFRPPCEDVMRAL